MLVSISIKNCYFHFCHSIVARNSIPTLSPRISLISNISIVDFQHKMISFLLLDIRVKDDNDINIVDPNSLNR